MKQLKKSHLVTFVGLTASALALSAGIVLNNAEQQHQLPLADVPDQLSMELTPVTAYGPAECHNAYRADQIELKPNSWLIQFPNGVEISAELLESDTVPSFLPASPQGIIYSPAQPIGVSEGASIFAGHVDYAPGQLSEAGGEPTAWKHIDAVPACTDIFVANEVGEVYQYQSVSLDTYKQSDLPEEKMFRADGSANAYWVTCSGPEVGDFGGELQFGYEDNLVLETELVLPAQT